ncbi:MAG: hypothetical protein OEU32_13785 [Acidimicrobiia bacterium]|nr:hypothetical protein [Acidimicrobiia bacterium]
MNPLTTATIRLAITVRLFTAAAVRRAGDERGEGVISAAIAVLIMAFLGVAAWLAFKGIFDSASSKAEGQVDQIGG